MSTAKCIYKHAAIMTRVKHGLSLLRIISIFQRST